MSESFVAPYEPNPTRGEYPPEAAVFFVVWGANLKRRRKKGGRKRKERGKKRGRKRGKLIIYCYIFIGSSCERD